MKQSSDYLLAANNVRKIDTEIAVILGVTESFILCQLQYWIDEKRKHPNKYESSFVNNRVWVYNSYTELMKQLPFIKNTVMRTTIYKLRDKGILLIDNFNSWSCDKKNWYSIDYDKLDEIIKEYYEEKEKKENDTVRIRQDTAKIRQSIVRIRQGTLSESDKAIPITTSINSQTNNITITPVPFSDKTENREQIVRKDYSKRYKKVKRLIIPDTFQCANDAKENSLYKYLVLRYLDYYRYYKDEEHPYYEYDYWDDHVSEIGKAICDHTSIDLDELNKEKIDAIIGYYFTQTKERFNRNFASFANYKMITGILNKVFSGNYEDYLNAGMIDEDGLPFI